MPRLGWIAAATVLALGCEPEVIHDHDGVPFYRLSGSDAEQQAVEFCFDQGNRETRYAGLSKDPVVFCCSRRYSKQCDLPPGHGQLAEEAHLRYREQQELQKPKQPQAYYADGRLIPLHEWTRAVSCGQARWEAGGELRVYNQQMEKVRIPVEEYQRALESHYRIAAPAGVERDAYQPEWLLRCP